MLSKSNFMQFLRCSCELWLVKQRPDLVPPTDPALQRIFDEGNVVDRWAQKLFPDAVNVDGFGMPAAVNTKKAIASGATVLLQPTFMTSAISCRSDILMKNDDGTWDIYEVKSSTDVKEDHIIDVAFQRICIEEAGVRVSRTFLVHVNNQYVRHGEIDPRQLFTKIDITHEVANAMPLAKKEIPRALAVLDWNKVPGMLHVASCSNPAECEFLSCYFPELKDDHIYSIATSLSKEKLTAFLERGLLKPEQIPADIMAELGDIKLPDAKTEPTLSIDKETIKSELDGLQYPLYFLDYETQHSAVPTFDGYRPYQQMVFQYSVHVVREPGMEPEHYEFLADEFKDPAPMVAESLKKHIGNIGSVIVWNARFEASRNAEIGEHLPEFADFMANINDRMYDLMMVVKKGYYVDSRFGGSASIKKVLPVMCPELSYNDLAIHEGGTASASWATLTNPTVSPETKEQLKKDMLAYCGLDTYAMIAIYRKFLDAVRS
jgi:CRISPR/Cas system-associated exonuclease Cas4 (RecB family)